MDRKRAITWHNNLRPWNEASRTSFARIKNSNEAVRDDVNSFSMNMNEAARERWNDWWTCQLLQTCHDGLLLFSRLLAAIYHQLKLMHFRCSNFFSLHFKNLAPVITNFLFHFILLQDKNLCQRPSFIEDESSFLCICLHSLNFAVLTFLMKDFFCLSWNKEKWKRAGQFFFRILSLTVEWKEFFGILLNEDLRRIS